MSSNRDAGGAESEHERLNRELDQLLQEIRVALPGVQVLFAFMLTVPFSSGFERIDIDARRAYGAAVFFAALATVLLIAPMVHHRLRFRDGIKEQMIRTANALSLAGAGCLGAAIGCALYVIGDVAFPQTPFRWVGPAMALLAAVLWFGLPLLYRADRTDRAASGSAEH